MKKYVKILILLLVGLCFVGCPKGKEAPPRFENITINKGYLSPGFSSENKEYTYYFEKDNNKIEIYCYLAEDSFTDYYTREIEVFDGEKIEIEVFNESKTKIEKYTITCKENNSEAVKKIYVKDNTDSYEGMIIGNEIIFDIPENIDKTNLEVELETVSSDSEVYINGEKQINGKTIVDFSKEVEIHLNGNIFTKIYNVRVTKRVDSIDDFLYMKDKENIKWFTINLRAGEVYEPYLLGEIISQYYIDKIEYYNIENSLISKLKYNRFISSTTDKKIFMKVNFNYNGNIMTGIGIKKSEPYINVEVGKEIIIENKKLLKVKLKSDISYTFSRESGEPNFELEIFDSNMSKVLDASTQSGSPEIYYYNFKDDYYYVYINPLGFYEKISLKITESDNFYKLNENEEFYKSVNKNDQFNFAVDMEQNQYYIIEHNKIGGNYAIVSNNTFYSCNSYLSVCKYLTEYSNIFSFTEGDKGLISLLYLEENKELNVKFAKADLGEISIDGKENEKKLSDKFHSNFYKVSFKAGKVYQVKYIDNEINSEKASANVKVCYFKEKKSGYSFDREQFIDEKDGTVFISPEKDEEYLINAYNKGYGGNLLISITEIDMENYKEEGGFKVVNSWGKDGSWENVKDGFYYLSYEAAKQLGRVYILEPDNSYSPKAVAVLNIKSVKEYREIEISTGSEESGIRSKKIRFDNGRDRNWFTTISGEMPNNNFVIDITDILPVENNMITLKINNTSYYNKKIAKDGKINYFAVELYNDYNSNYIARSVCSKLPAEWEEQQCSLEIDGSGLKYKKTRNIEKEGILKYKSNIKSTVNEYRKEEKKKFYRGTGLIVSNPKKVKKYEEMGKLFRLDSKKIMKTKSRNLEPEKIDLSSGKYFPPIGDQLNQGSCVAWSMAYYITTYNYAKSRNIDISAIKYNSKSNSFSNYNNVIMSPAFMYNVGNGGEDLGMEPEDALEELSTIGTCSWEKQPYTDSNYTNMGSEEAWREAVKQKAYKIKYMGYIDIAGEDDIEALKMLLSEGYMISIAVDAYQYEKLLNNDMLLGIDFDNSSFNHMNTIVGYDDTISGGK